MTTTMTNKYEVRIAEIIDVKLNQPNLSEKHLDKLNNELENGLRINHHKVHKSKKSYNRQENKRLANSY